MSKMMKEFSVVFRAAFDDTRKNIFRPIRNARVILGLEHEPSIAEKIERAREQIKEKPKTGAKGNSPPGTAATG